MFDLLCPGLPTSILGEMGCAVVEFGGWPWILAVGVLLLLGAAWKLRARVIRVGSSSDGPTIVFPEWKAVDAARPAAPDVPRFSEARAEAARSRNSPRQRTEEFEASGSAPNTFAGIDPPAPDPTERIRMDPSPSERARWVPPAGIQNPGHADPALRQGVAKAGSTSYEPPPEGTLQLLPGRLEIVSGVGTGEEIRFVRLPSEEPAVTFGRSTGRPHRHIQLDSPTVSRLHARFHFNGARWQLTNLSNTNPTVLNGRHLDGESDQVTLADGDRIELGDVVLVFHHRETHDRLPLRSSWYTDRGRRATNQDAVAISTLSDGRELAVVCDGMGSHAAGGVASHMAMEGLTEALQGGASLGEAVRKANAVIWEDGRKAADHDGMATTMVVLLRDGDQYRIANVGDSRAYRIDGDGVHHITRDHSFAAEAVRNGEMSKEEADRSPWKHAVTRMLGAGEEVQVDVFGPYSATVAHLVVLCSDGVHGVLTDDDLMARIVAVPDVEVLAKDLGEEALRSGSKDNVGVAVVAFAGGLAPAVKTGT